MVWAVRDSNSDGLWLAVSRLSAQLRAFRYELGSYVREITQAHDPRAAQLLEQLERRLGEPPTVPLPGSLRELQLAAEGLMQQLRDAEDEAVVNAELSDAIDVNTARCW
jgi:hypothetical protein